jgi:signal transduction histidine kinase
LSPGGAHGASRGRKLVYPLLMECDHSGRVLWMSEYTRRVLGPSASLLHTIPRWRGPGDSQEGPGELVYSKLLDLGGTVLIGARPVLSTESAPGAGEPSLFRIQGQLLLHYFRLLRAERQLAGQARRRRGPGGIRALRQIELERERLGRELHTSVGQQLSAIRLQAEVIAGGLPAGHEPLRQAVDRIFALTAEALELVRSISKRLHPPEWQRLSLCTALQQLWELSGIPQRFEASLRLGPLPQEPELDAKILLYRAAQEAVSNLIRHSRASRVEVSLEERAGELVLRFQDNGVGFNVETVFAAAPKVIDGIGLRSIRDQAASLGGKLVVASGPDGTKLEVIVPFNAAGA